MCIVNRKIMGARYKGLVILAKYGTNERMIVFVNPHQFNVQKMVIEKYGGDWVIVNELCSGDILKFEATEPYLGFDSQRQDDNYCTGALEIGAFR